VSVSEMEEGIFVESLPRTLSERKVVRRVVLGEAGGVRERVNGERG
jgi:hypothetical protein